ncbi:MAG: FAD-dependent oxidoreductase [Clostridiales bacterium]|nr:FAD-dependent oxidoreductase [Clostridiales bacterium]
MKEIRTDVAILGAGSAGFAAAYTLATAGASVAIADKNTGYGGTSVFGGVNCWEPGVCSGKVHRLLAERLPQIPGASAVCRTVPNGELLYKGSGINDFSRFPWGLSVPDSGATYDDTLFRCLSLSGGDSAKYRRFQFEPRAMERVMRDMLDLPNVTFLPKTEFVGCTKENRRITGIVLRGEEEIRVIAKRYIDASGDIVLARAAGCLTRVGAESRGEYGEPGAPDAPDESRLNGASVVFRIRAAEPGHIDTYDGNVPPPTKTVSCFNLYPNGDINVNMLPTLSGGEFLRRTDAFEYGKELVRSYVFWLQTEKGLSGYALSEIFSMPGIRESYRLVGRRVLTENDVRAGIIPDDSVAIADHALDSHGESGLKEIEKPYGIPADCLRPKEYDNLLVACRGASFSHIAASSARLSRTMLSLGEGAAKLILDEI